ncbi:MAG TPA: DUF2510 domain-containing protein [Pseudolysinimonas sp.]
MSDTTALTVPPAGWYPDRNAANTLRWWDGTQWTDHTHSVAPEQAVEQPVSAAAFGFTPVEPNPVAGGGLPAASVATPAAAAAATAAATALAAPGWYPDNTDRTIQRWWDGTQWTAHTTPSVTATVTAATSSPVSSAKNTMATVALVLALVSFGGVIFAPLLLLAISGIIIGIVALLRAPRYGPTGGRRGQAIAGIVLGAFSVITSIVLVVAALGVYQQGRHDIATQTAPQQTAPPSGTEGDGAGVFLPSTVSELRSQISTSVGQHYSVAVTTVTCDAAASMEAGSEFVCGVIVSDGRWDSIQVQIGRPAGTGMSTGLSYGPLVARDATVTSPRYTVDFIKEDLATNLAQAWESPVSDVSCDADDSASSGSMFECGITLGDGRAGNVRVTLLDPTGYDVSILKAPASPGDSVDSGGSTDPDLSHS